MKFKAIFIFAQLFLISITHADETWLKKLDQKRTFVTIDIKSNQFSVNEFEQNYGDYQDKIKSFKFKELKEAYLFIAKNYQGFNKQNQIEKWPIFIGSKDKGLFGKTNENIWEVKKFWSDEEELNYSKWIETNVTLDFLKKYNIATDCADVTVALRWIYARINYLPAANTLASSGDLFGQFSLRSKWKRLKKSNNWNEDELFLTALNYMLDETSTQTVGRDSYPVALEKNALRPGVYNLRTSHNEGHVKVILESHFNEITSLPIYTIASTVPRQVRTLSREVFNDQEWPFYLNDKEMEGFLSFRWPILNGNNWVLKAKELHTTYSLEQFDNDLKNSNPSFINYIINKLNPVIEESNLVDAGINDLKNFIDQRIEAVKGAREFCLKNKCAENSENYSNLSTPNRDEKLVKKFQDMISVLKEISKQKSENDLLNEWNSKLSDSYVLIEGNRLSLKDIFYLFSNKLTSFDPNDLPSKRWGLENERMVNQLVVDLKDGLINREFKVNRTNDIDVRNCSPRTNCFIEYNTFHHDSLLNLNYVKLISYCSIGQSKICEKIKNELNSTSLTLNNLTKTTWNWIQTIPLFNSDPRASNDRKWGILNPGEKSYVFSAFDDLKISKNNLALLNSKKIIDLDNKTVLYNASEEEKLILDPNGIFYSYNLKNHSILKYSFLRTELKLISEKIIDPLNLLLLDIKSMSSFDFGEKLVFKIKTLDKNIIFQIQNNQIEYIDEYNKNFTSKNELIFIIRENKKMTLIDLKKGKSFNLIADKNISLVDLNNLSISSYSYPNILMQYSDQLSDLYFPVLINLEENIWTKFDLSLDNKVFVKWSDLSLKKAIFETNYFSGIPNLFAISWDEAFITKSVKLSNQLRDIKTIGNKVNFLVSAGTPWESNPLIEFYTWDESLVKVSHLDQKYKYQFLVEDMAYATDENNGILVNSDLTKKTSLAPLLIKNYNGLKIENTDQNNYSFRFSTEYGNYSFDGGNINLNSKSPIFNFTTYSWIDSENQNDQNWVEIFSRFHVFSGSILTNGQNFAVWWN